MTAITNTETTLSTLWFRNINRMQWNALFAAFLGWMLDAFDFVLYNFTIITLIKDWGLTTVQTGFVATITMVASSFGGMFFGYLADRHGRLKALTITILMYSVATGLCGLSQALWQLMLARLLVGLGMGGEWSAGAALVAETWPAEHRGKAMSIMQSGYALGGMLAAALAGPIIAAYGWRILFFVGTLPAILAWWIRRHIDEPDVWKKNVSDDANTEVVKVKWLDLFRGKLLKTTLAGSIFCTLCLVASYPEAVWLPSYLGASAEKGGLGLTVIQSSHYILPYYFGSIVGYWVFGYLCDKIGRKPTFAAYLILGGISLIAFVTGGSLDNMVTFFALIILAGCFGVGFYGGFGMVVGEMYPTKVRASGQGFCYNLARGIAGFAVTGAGAFAGTIGLGNTLMYSGGIFFVAVLTLLLIPETKGTRFE